MKVGLEFSEAQLLELIAICREAGYLAAAYGTNNPAYRRAGAWYRCLRDEHAANFGDTPQKLAMFCEAE